MQKNLTKATDMDNTKKTLAQRDKSFLTKLKIFQNDKPEVKPLSTKWIKALFVKFQVLYGPRWVSQITGLESLYFAEWSEGLKHLTGKQIKHGLTQCRALEWPPTVAEFVKLSTSRNKVKLHGEAYKLYKPPVKPNQDRNKAQYQINQMKQKLKGIL